MKKWISHLCATEIHSSFWHLQHLGLLRNLKLKSELTFKADKCCCLTFNPFPFRDFRANIISSPCGIILSKVSQFEQPLVARSPMGAPAGKHKQRLGPLSGPVVSLSTCRLWIQALGCDLGEDGLCSQHAALHGGVGAFDLWDVHETGAAAYQQPPGERQLRDGLPRKVESGTFVCFTLLHSANMTRSVYP